MAGFSTVFYTDDKIAIAWLNIDRIPYIARSTDHLCHVELHASNSQVRLAD